jgi:hypothetical protein
MLRWIARQTGPFAIRQFLNTRYRRFGQMTQLRIDNARKTIDIELLLEGEQEPITIYVPNYTFTPDSPAPTLTLADPKVSRPWLDRLAAELLANRPLPIPANIANLLRLVL